MLWNWKVYWDLVARFLKWSYTISLSIYPKSIYLSRCCEIERFIEILWPGSWNDPSLYPSLFILYLSICLDVLKLKGLLRSCGRVLEMILHYIPLSGGAFFPHRIQIFIEILGKLCYNKSVVKIFTISCIFRLLIDNKSLIDEVKKKYLCKKNVWVQWNRIELHVFS